VPSPAPPSPLRLQLSLCAEPAGRRTRELQEAERSESNSSLQWCWTHQQAPPGGLYVCCTCCRWLLVSGSRVVKKSGEVQGLKKKEGRSNLPLFSKTHIHLREGLGPSFLLMPTLLPPNYLASPPASLRGFPSSFPFRPGCRRSGRRSAGGNGVQQWM
jgi:hypothetical protein